MVRSLIRYEQVRRRGDAPDVQSDDARFTEGRYFEASCLSAANVNDCVRVTGTNGGGRPKVRLCDPNDPTLMPMTGIIVEKASPQVCLVQVSGQITSLAGLVAGEMYFVGLAGQPVTPAPSTVRQQLVGVALQPSRLLLYPNQALVNPTPSYAPERDGIALIGTKNGVNRSFETPEVFVHSGGATIRVYHNGHRLQQAPSPNPSLGDYFVSEGGGIGTGYDTITFLTLVPVPTSGLYADYRVA